MKKMIAVIVAAVMLLSLVACNQSAEDKVADYADEAKEKLEGMFGGSGIGIEVEAEGCGIIVDLKISDLNNITASQKQELQRYYDSMSGTFESLLEDMQDEVPELEYMVFNVCDSDGELAAKVEIGK